MKRNLSSVRSEHRAHNPTVVRSNRTGSTKSFTFGMSTIRVGGGFLEAIALFIIYVGVAVFVAGAVWAVFL